MEDRTYETYETYKRYKIIRFKFKEGSEVIKRGLSLVEARAWCSRDDTHGEGWFDGYDEE